MGTEPVPAPWSPVRRVLFRFAWIYLVLYTLPFPFDLINMVWPSGPPIKQWYDGLWDPVVLWVGQHVFGVEITIRPNGSGDTTYNYVQIACFAALAVAFAAVWSVLDRKRQRYDRLDLWLRADVRFYLAAQMINYGVVKVIKMQFPDPTLDRLVQPFGDASPMGLLWTFMGVSQSYNFFTGAGEMVGGLLLTTRRTTLLGALVSAGVMAHIVMLNFSYDVPVKLFSAHLLLMALFLAAPDLRRLADFFVLSRPAEPAPRRRLVPWRWPHRIAVVVRTLLVLAYVGWPLYQMSVARARFGDLGRRSPLYGIWAVEEFTTDGTARPPSDESRWRRVVFDTPTVTAIQLMSDHRIRFRSELKLNAQTLTLTTYPDGKLVTTLTVDQPASDRLLLEGMMDGKTIRAGLRREPDPEFLLRNRGFHWINEYPFNR